MARKRTISKRSTGVYIKSESISDPVGMLAAQIVIHAVADWRDLVRMRAWLDAQPQANFSFDELRAFFNGEWCGFLMQKFEVTPADILDALETELAMAKLQPPKKSKNRKG